MAQKIELDLSVLDKGQTLKARKRDSDDLNSSLEKGRQLATGTKTGGRAAAASYSPAMETAEYGRARGSMGATGAGARDFANQAQGLGGLVRLYATYAANLFAVTAAFSALREAMNTDIMIRGMDQLGAASGVALGGLAKRFAEASDGAISFREAAEATTKAMSSGLTTEQFLKLGQVAKGASQALGVSMSDAVSRLTRGITKLEPELLDELGIFTKVGKATEEYAKSIGKAESQLTDFERRQAFANAVLVEGAEKFGKIAGEANPYDKLLASFKNTAQQILSTVNSIIAPIAKLLADNTELIGIAIGAATLKITQQALPALSSWQAGLAKSAQEASKRAQEINTSFGEAFVERQAAKFKLPDIQGEVARVRAELSQVDKEFSKVQAYKRPKQSGVLKSIQEDRLLSTRELANAEKEVAKYSDRTDEASKKHAEVLSRKISLQKELVLLQKQEALIQDKIVDAATERSKLLSGEWQREQIVLNERAKAARLNLVQGVGTKVQEQGLIGGLGGFYKEVDSSKDLGRFDKLRTKALGTFAGVATAAGILGNALSSAFGYLQIAVVAFGILNMVFSKNTKQVDEFNGSIDSLNESLKTATNVNKEYQSVLSIESINARANAFTGLSDSIKQATTNLIQADANASWLDRFVDGWKTLWGGDLKSTFDTGLADTIIGAIQAMPEGSMREELETKLKNTTGAVDLSRAGLLDAFSKLGTEATKAMGLKVSEDLKRSKTLLQQSQAITQDIKETSKSVTDAYTALKNSIVDKSPVNTFLAASVKQALNLKKALQDVTSAQIILNEIAKGQVKPEFLTEESALALVPLAQQTAELSKTTERYADRLSSAKKRLSELNAEISKKGNYTWYDAQLRNERVQIEETIKYLTTALNSAQSKISEIAQQAKILVQNSIADQIDQGLNQTRIKLAQLANQAQQGLLSQLPVKTPESIKAIANLERNALKLDQEMLNVQQRLITSIDKLRLQIEIDTDKRELEKLKTISAGAEGRDRVLFDEQRRLLETRISKNTAAVQAYDVKDLKTLSELAKSDPALRPLLDSVQSIVLANQQYAIKLNSINLKEQIDTIRLNFERKLEESKSNIFKLTQERDLIPGTDAAAEAQRAKLSERIREAEQKQLGLVAEKDTQITGAVSKYLNIQDGESVIASQKAEIERVRALGVEQKAIENSVAKTKENRNITLKQLQEENQAAKLGREIEENTAKLQDEKARAGFAYAREEISYKQQLGVLSADEARAQLNSIALQEAELARTEKLRQAKEQQTQAEAAYNEAVKANGGVVNDVLTAQKKAYESTYTTAVEGANNAYEAQLKLMDLQNRLNERQTAYTDLFKQAFKGMEDAIIEFAKTGKLSFSSMINSFIEGLLRFELQQQQMSLLKSTGGFGGLASIFMKMFGLGTPAANTNVPLSIAKAGYADTGPMGLMYAKGGAFDYGIEKFARGGMFTNSIVDSPTLFKFAKGTGLMGEAGPEAIMPLKRDANGNLGVRAGGGGNVEVVVNNYSTAQAETRETTDSRGNRRIEVVVGEMVAGEVARTGSQTQQAFMNTFGTRPALARR